MISTTKLVSVVLIAAAAPAFADAGDPPSRVARLNYESGSVSFRPGSADDWSPASPNYPLTIGDHLWADRNARAEMHIGSTAVRMDSETALSVLNLDDRTVQLSLTAGVIVVRLRALDEDQTFEVDTPNVAISLLRPGNYRIQADGDGATTSVAVWSGEAELTGGGSAFPVHPRQAARIIGTDSITNEVVDLPPRDPFVRWSEDRDRREDQAQSVRYVPREMIGYEDLDAYGAWRNVPPYGWVWTPASAAVGWAPYRYGHWVWVSPWGWTWVDDAPWGFAPFHYGRWAYAGGAWVWVPGQVVARPVYAPALVAFVGGPRFGLSVAVGGGGGGVAWFPLGPGEIYRPAYHVSDVYVRNVNVTHVNVTNINVTNVNVTNVRYVNQNVQGAVTAVPQQTFVSARPVGREATIVSAREASQAQVVGSTAAVAPRPESIVARPPTAGPVARPPAQILQHTVVAKAAPPPPPVSFRTQQQQLERNPGRPLDNATLDTLRTNQPAAPQVRSALPRAQSQPPIPENNTSPTARPPSAGVPRNDRPSSAQPPLSPPAGRQSRAVDQPASPAPNRQPVTPDRPIQNERPAAATQPAAPVPNPRPLSPDRPVRNDRPAETTQPATPAPSPRPVSPDRPVRNDRPAETTQPATPAPSPRPVSPDRPVRNDRPAATTAARPEGRGPTNPPKSEKKAEKREERQEKHDR